MLEDDVDNLEAQLPVLLDELLTGGGALVVRQAFPPAEIAEARRLITYYSSTEDDNVTHLHGAHEDEVHFQRRVRNLLDKGEVFERMVQHPRGDARAGDFVVINGMVWQCAMPNQSDADRTRVLIEYLAKFVTPLKDQKRGVRQEVVDRASPMLRQLMGLDDPYPTLLDEVEAGVAYGRHAKA